MNYRSFEDMPVWQKAMDLAARVFRLTQKLPRKEDYGLTSQVRRAGLSVSGNIAEGFGRKHTNDKLNFYYAARGSLCETKSHLIFGQRVAYFPKPEFDAMTKLIEETWKELNSLIASLRPSSRSRSHAMPQP